MVNPKTEFLQKVRTLCKQNLRYKPEAYTFVLAALHFTVSRLPQRRHDSEITSGAASSSRSHVTGQELLEGIRIYGMDQFGPLTRQVFEHWGVQSTEDFGRIVFSLVDIQLLGKTDEDSLADFQGVYNFAQAFNPQPLFKLSDTGWLV
ncbi:MAG: hypothetical protein HY211_07665 [Candidatus Omnitrophica bacterium]|nr:hypothetical protein [Candidatus Omnitrophota bacterium]